MEVKKSQKADLEGKKLLFSEIGLALALVITLGAFEWSQSDTKIEVMDVPIEATAEDDLPPITTQEEIKPPPPPPPPPVTEVFTIVEDDVEITEEANIGTTDANEEQVIDIPEPAPEIEEEPVEDNEVFLIVEQMPQFPGGDLELRKFLAKEVKYPVIAQENGISGRVFVKFVINKDGSVTDVQVARSVDPNLDKEAIRVVKSMPKWSPGKQRGNAVRVSYTVPINFVLQ